MCNLMFSVSMLCDLVLIMVTYEQNEDLASPSDWFDLAVLIFKLLERLACVAFFVVATFIYARLWSLYRYDGRSLGRRFCQILPALLSSAAIRLGGAGLSVARWPPNALSGGSGGPAVARWPPRAITTPLPFSALMLLGFFYNDGEYSSYIWDNFTRR